MSYQVIPILYEVTQKNNVETLHATSLQRRIKCIYGYAKQATSRNGISLKLPGTL